MEGDEKFRRAPDSVFGALVLLGGVRTAFSGRWEIPEGRRRRVERVWNSRWTAEGVFGVLEIPGGLKNRVLVCVAGWEDRQVKTCWALGAGGKGLGCDGCRVLGVPRWLG